MPGRCVGVCLALVGCEQLLLMQSRCVGVCLALVSCQQLLNKQGRCVGVCAWHGLVLCRVVVSVCG